MTAKCRKMSYIARKRKASEASSQSWKRANKLSLVAECGNATLARSYIAEKRGELGDIETILDSRMDKRNEKVRKLITDFSRWLKSN